MSYFGLKQRKEINLNYLTNKVKRYSIHIGEWLFDTAVSYGIRRVKEYFGKEYILRNSNEINAFIENFIMKYDLKSKKHLITLHGEKKLAKDSMFIIQLDTQTYMYVSSGFSAAKTFKNYSFESRSDDIMEDISNLILVYIFGKKHLKYARKLEKEVFPTNDSLSFYTVDSGKRRYGDDNDEENLYIVWHELVTRSMDTLFFMPGVKENTCKHIDSYLASKNFYNEKQLLYKTGIMLYGSPGTGKSSLARAIATKYHRSILAINMANINSIDLNSLTESINIDNKKYIVLLEDIDTIFKLNREEKNLDIDDKKVINKLLNFLDSSASPNDVIFIATTNHIEDLDEALLRDGRFDIKINVGKINESVAKEYCESFGLNNHEVEQVLHEYKEEYKKTHDNIPDEYINQSALQTRILKVVTAHTNMKINVTDTSEEE